MNELNNMTLPDAAIWYAKNGYKVIPLAPKGKHPITKNGLKDAANDLAQIRAWWDKTPDANIGLLCGQETGFFVLDIDGEYPNGCPELPETTTVQTGRGKHFYFSYPNITPIPTRTKVNGHDIDVRSDNSYIVAPPSIHPQGDKYAYIK